MSTPKTITAENLAFLLEFLKKSTNQSVAKHARIAPTAQNSVKLLLLHDLKEIIAPAKKDGLFDQDALEEILTEEYRKKFKAGNCSFFFNLRTTLEEEQYAEHFKALLEESPVAESRLN